MRQALRSPDAAQRAALRRGVLLIRGPCASAFAVGPGSAEQRYTLHRVRDAKLSLDSAHHAIAAGHPKRWRDIWGAGHSTSGVIGVLSFDDLVARIFAEDRGGNFSAS